MSDFVGGGLMSDLIDRQTAIKAIEDLQDCYNGFSDSYDKACIIGVLEELPSVELDISEYSDRLWKLAYERGKTEGIVRCKDCTYSEGFPWSACPMLGKVILKDDDFCSQGERRIDELGITN